ncbi:ligase-associated DNA damage response endonuclease PdeM [Marinoscillum pacificum]|uniref:ligase-associated DNA damage response endonuclease PdeM n=1 Tax=Marinoscillum pacificum TaxID=392723 RepID=UPI0021586A9B|nr:ligase-associated DNA damage response endonuclease PdeM [Marinoscillum pacificum]
MKGSPELLGANYKFQFLDQEFVLDADRAIYWQEDKSLIVADLHLGKAGHFRKHGVPIPRQVHITDLQKMNSLINRYQPEKILFLGDLFHSDNNEEWMDFIEWSNHHSGIQQLLIEGNHDILDEGSYLQTRMKVVDEYQNGPFLLTHEEVKTDLYNISGHVHPCVRLHGIARQGARLPCFQFGKQKGLIPAFGEFTGSHPIRPLKTDRIFAIAEGQLIGLVG